MAVFTITVRGKRSDGYYPVYICVNHKSKPSYMKTHFVVSERGIKKIYTQTGKEKTQICDIKVLRECMNEIAVYTRRLNEINTDSMTVQEIVGFLNDNDADISFTDFANNFISDMESNGREHSASNYQMAINRLHEYMGRKHINFSDITSKVLTSWIESMMESPRKRNLYPSCIRRIYAAGMSEYNDEDMEIFKIKKNPFVKVVIPKSKQPEKRSLTTDTIRRFFDVPVEPLHGREVLALDVCKIMFCLAGINTADLYDLPVGSLSDGILHYKRKKTRDKSLTGSYTEIEVQEIIRPILNQYKGEKRLFCFSEKYASPEDFASMIGKACKRICEKVGIKEKITPYSFRHSWATIAINECGASMDDVAFALNHASAHRITSIYIKPDYKRIDRLNEKVIGKVFPQVATGITSIAPIDNS